jgi:hypothetical protein
VARGGTSRACKPRLPRVSWFSQRVGEAHTAKGGEIEELPDDPGIEAPEPDELPEGPEPLPEETPGELPSEQAGEAETTEVPAELSAP